MMPMNAAEKKKQIIDLWQTCFQDSASFIDLYFQEVYRDENALTVVENGRLLSALQMIPYRMTCWGVPFSMAYISGASTAPEARNRGLMSDLLKRAFRIMLSRRIAFSALIPAGKGLFDYYARFGYAPVCFVRHETVRSTEVPAHPGPIIPSASDERCIAYLERRMSERSCCVQHEPTDYRALIRDLRSEGGDIVSVSDRTGICGVAWGSPSAGGFEVKECFFDSDEARSALFRACFDRFGGEECRYRRPAGPDGDAFGMVRIVDAEPLLTTFAEKYPDRCGTIGITDPLIPENRAVFAIREGGCTRVENGPTNADQELTIAELTRSLFLGGDPFFPIQQPYLSLMFD